MYVFEQRRIAPHGSVGCKNNVMFLNIVPAFLAGNAAEIEDAQPRREPRRLLFPVEDEGSRCHDESGSLPLIRIQQRQHLNGFSQPHVVREASAEPKTAEESEPA